MPTEASASAGYRSGAAPVWCAWLLPLALGLAARIVLGAAQPLMFDEAWTIRQAADLSLDMQLGRLDAHPPLSYLLFAGWGLPSWSIGWLRVFPITLSLVTIYASALLARRLFGESAVMPTVWILALWPLPLYAAWPIRYYAILMLLSALYLLCWARPLAREAAVPERPVLCSTLEAVLVHTVLISLPLILVLNAYGVLRLGSQRQWWPLARWTARCLLVGLLCIPQLLIYRSVASQVATAIVAYPSLGLHLDLLIALKSVVLTELPYWHDAALRPLWTLPGLVGVMVSAGLLRRERLPWPPLIVLVATVVAVAIGIRSGLRQGATYYLATFPLVGALVGAGLGRVGRTARVATLSLVAAVSFLRVADPTYHWAWGDTAAVARLADRVAPDIPIVYLDTGNRAFIDATQFKTRRSIALVGEEETLPGARAREAEGWIDPVSRDQPFLLQPANLVYAEQWSVQRWAGEMVNLSREEMYLIVPVQSRAIAARRVAGEEERRQAAMSIMAPTRAGWVITESKYRGTVVFHLRRR